VLHLHVLASTPPSGLQQLWFVLIAVLWLGYSSWRASTLASDFAAFSATTHGRRVMINTIGPVWTQ